jgi:hypothetical protein
MHAIFYSGNVKGRYHTGEQEVDGRVIFKWILEECGMRTWSILLILDRMEWLAFPEQGSGPYGSVKDKDFFYI